jgi:pilus assembly protein Flp/PilA
MPKTVYRFMRDESGATAVEYGLIAALIALAIVTGATSIGNSINAKFTTIGTRVASSGS